MKLSLQSTAVPDVSGVIKREIAYNKRVDPVDEMRYWINKYSTRRDFKVQIREEKSNLKIKFTDSNYSWSTKVNRSLSAEPVDNRAFDTYDYDLELLSISLKIHDHQPGTFLELIYWGDVNNDQAENFVQNNAKVVKQRIEFGRPSKKSNTTRSRFVATDVNAYTKDKIPNPWCRGSMLVLFENNDLFKKIKEHPKLGVPESKFEKIYADNLFDPKIFY